MNDLFDEILVILRKYRVDAIYRIHDIYYTLREVEQLQVQKITQYLSEMDTWKTVALYGGGGYCESILDAVKESGKNILCIIDNFKAGIENMKNGTSFISMEKFLKEYKNRTDAVIISSWNYQKEFEAELILKIGGGGIFNVPAWAMEQYPEFTKPVYEYMDSYRKGYVQINELEMQYKNAEGKEKYDLLKKIILALCWIKDFLYAEKYVCAMEKEFQHYGESVRYRKAMDEIKKVMEECVSQIGKDVLFIHVVDSLSDQVVSRMPWLNTHAEKGVRFRGITVQYPYTHYAMNTMFTGKSPFDIEKTTENMTWDDSALLKYIHKKYTINVVSGNGHVMQQFEKIIDNPNSVYPYLTLTEALFEGLALWGKNREKNIIVVHSCGEVHSSFLRTGAETKLVLCKDMTEMSQFEKQFHNAVDYTDEELQWYDSYYSLTKMPMITMGDHGISMESEYNYYLGEKKDLTRGIEEMLTSACIVSRWMENGKEINRLISNTKIPKIIEAILKDQSEGLDLIGTNAVLLEFPPGYQESYCQRFMSQGIWGQYEGFVGIKTLKEIYLVSASGKELYFVPEEYGYINLRDNKDYFESVEHCKKMMENQTFPIELFKLKKYRTHMELLKIYDQECYQRILDKMEGTNA